MTNYQFLIMHRVGMFTPGSMTDNQCTKCGHEEYHYRLVMAFDDKVSLDERKFIFDSLDLTGLICELKPSGSCEEMHHEIGKCIEAFFKKRDIDILCWKFAIVDGASAKNRSWFEHVSFNAITKIPRIQKIMFLTPHLL